MCSPHVRLELRVLILANYRVPRHALRGCGAVVTMTQCFTCVIYSLSNGIQSAMTIAKNKTTHAGGLIFGSPNRIRTGVLALKGRCPRPLDDGAKTAAVL